jgi:hypothetical protein
MCFRCFCSFLARVLEVSRYLSRYETTPESLQAADAASQFRRLSRVVGRDSDVDELDAIAAQIKAMI